MSNDDPGRSPDDVARGIILGSAMQGERIVSMVRILFTVCIAVRAFWIWDTWGWEQEWVRGLLAFPAFGAAIGFSVFSLTAMQTRPHSERVLQVSVAVDVLFAFTALLTNPLWPWDGYLGLVNMPDLAALVVVIFASGLRLSPSAAVLGGGLGSMSYVVLMAVDRAVSGATVPVEMHHYVLYGLIVLGAAALAVIVAVRTRRLAERIAHAAVQADRAKRSLDGLMRDHHDVRTLLTSAQLNVDMAAGALGAGESSSDDRLGELVAHVSNDLRSMHRLIDDIKVRAYSELVAMELPQRTSLGAALDESLSLLRPCFPAVQLAAGPFSPVSVTVSAGALGARRILFNLIANACQGSHGQGPTRVEIEVHEAQADGLVKIMISDDGPGFPLHLLARSSADGTQLETSGPGLGLGLVNALVRASAGNLRLANAEQGGAVVVIELPA